MLQRESPQPDLFAEERRDAVRREELVNRIIADFQAIGGVALTERQAQQLFNVEDTERFRRILQELIARRVIKVGPSGLLLRGDGEPGATPGTSGVRS